jgi:hypothetical protein
MWSRLLIIIDTAAKYRYRECCCTRGGFVLIPATLPADLNTVAAILDIIRVWWSESLRASLSS